MNGNSNGGGARGIFSGIRPAQIENLNGDALKRPWQQYRQLIILHALTVSSVFAMALLIGPAAKALSLGAFLAYGTWWFWWAEHDVDTRALTTLGGLLFLAADAALFLYWPLLLTIQFPWQWWAKLWGVLILASVAWEAPFLKARYEQEIVDPSYSAPRTAIDGRYPPQTSRRLQERMDYEALPPLATEVEPEVLHTHEEIIRPLDVHTNARTHLVRSTATRAGHVVLLDDVYQMLDAQPRAGFTRSYWTKKRNWKRKQFDDALKLLEELDLIQPHAPGGEASLHTWEARIDGETETNYWRTMARLTMQHAKDRLR